MKSIYHALCALCALAAPVSAADLGRSDEPIRLALGEQIGAQITAHVAGELLKAAGYDVAFVPVEDMAVFRQMDRGLIDAALEVWPANAAPSYRDLTLERKIESLGDLGLIPTEGLAYPAHMEALCPGLPAWEALRDCAAAFETDGAATVLDYPVDWEGPATDLVAALGLPFTVTPAESEEALVDALVAASTEGKPALAMFWRPHWAVAAYDLRFVTLPEAEAACFEDPAWGPNPTAVGDCGFPALSTEKSLVAGFKTKWPAAYFLLKDFQITAETQETLMIAVERDGQTPAQAAALWASENEALWRPLVEGATN
jgi:glycine betaine/proline transport system substrate-binding protein